MKFIKFLIPVLVLGVVACQQTEQVHFDEFLAWQDQAKVERMMKYKLEPEQTISLNEMGVLTPIGLEQDGQYLYTIDHSQFRIAKIDKKTGELSGFIDYREGKGPGEVIGQMNFLVAEDEIILLDHRNKKLVYFSKNGEFQKEKSFAFGVSDMTKSNDGRITILAPMQNDSLFTILNNKFEKINSFGKGRIQLQDVMKYVGYVTSDSKRIYFAGYSEPFLRGYRYNGKLLFSKSNIDNYKIGKQYRNMERGNRRIAAFAEDAKFSTRDIEVFGNYLLLAPHHNNNENYTYLDVYNKFNGDYKFTIDTGYWVRQFTLDDEYIYITREDSASNYYIVKYKNPIK